MAPEPKGARKRTVKKSAAKVEGDSTAVTSSSAEITTTPPILQADAAPAPAVEKRTRTRAKAPVALPPTSEAAVVNQERPTAAAPSVIFQAPPAADQVKPAKEKTGKSAGASKGAGAKGKGDRTARIEKSDSEKLEEQESATEDSAAAEDGADRNQRRNRGSRGGRGRRQRGEDQNLADEDSAELSGDEAATDANLDDRDDSDEDGSDEEGSHHRRRRRRRARGASSSDEGTTVEEDGVITTVKVREPRAREHRDQPRTDRASRRDRGRDRERERGNRRDFTRRRGSVITESEFLARRENVNRVMLVKQQGDRTQIAVLEDKILVEHYVNRNSNISYVGNVYLGRVQNVLPSMEAAFVDIGKGRNAVLYAGEVNWDAAGMAESSNRKIEHVLKTGQSVLVQVTKDPIGQKGARLTSQISLPGRYLVYVPSGEMSGISRRLPDNERSRLKTILKGVVGEEAGVIVRTAAEGASEDELTQDIRRLQSQWEEIQEKAENPSTSAPSLLYGEPDLTVRVIRDIFNEDFNQLIVQGEQAWGDINDYLGHIAPELTNKIEKWTGTRDLFVENRIEEQLAKAFDRKVYLPSGGSLVIDRTEAMVVIDVNTGKFIGKGGNLEETVTKNNLEAAEEIARQLRLRDLGGIIVIDFIDMVLESNREQVLRRLVEALGRDRTKHQVAEVTSLGLVQMTRKRIGQGLIEAFSTTCESCGGRGIHIHTEPVQKVDLDKDMDQPFVPSSKRARKNGERNRQQGGAANAAEGDLSESDLAENESDSASTAADLAQAGQVNPIDRVDSEVELNSSGRPKRRRRAVSTGIITTGAEPEGEE
jgi:Rne/Rng family ribonuclease